jgi:hypothetical protein
MLFGVVLFIRASQQFQNNQDEDPLRRKFQVVYAIMVNNNQLTNLYLFINYR